MTDDQILTCLQYARRTGRFPVNNAATIKLAFGRDGFLLGQVGDVFAAERRAFVRLAAVSDPQIPAANSEVTYSSISRRFFSSCATFSAIRFRNSASVVRCESNLYLIISISSSTRSLLGGIPTFPRPKFRRGKCFFVQTNLIEACGGAAASALRAAVLPITATSVRLSSFATSMGDFPAALIARSRWSSSFVQFLCLATILSVTLRLLWRLQSWRRKPFLRLCGCLCLPGSANKVISRNTGWRALRLFAQELRLFG